MSAKGAARRGYEMRVQLKRYRFTTTDYHRMAEAGILGEDDRVELIEGEILEMSPIGRLHASTVDRLNRLFNRAVGDAAIVRVQNPIVVNDYNEPQPDLTLLRPRTDFYAAGHPTPEAILLAIEVADTTVAFDRRVKAPLYARNGMPELWLIDLKRGHVVAFRDPTETGYATTQVFRRGEAISPVAFPDLVLPVAELLG